MNPTCAPTAVPNATNNVAAVAAQRQANRIAISASASTPHAASSLHRFDVLERQLTAAKPVKTSGNFASSELTTHRREPLPPAVASDLMRITKRMAQDPDLIARMAAIVMEEHPCDEIPASDTTVGGALMDSQAGVRVPSRDESDCGSPYDVVSLHYSPNMTERLGTSEAFRVESNVPLSSPNRVIQRRLPVADGRSPAKSHGNAKQVFLQDPRRRPRELVVSCASESTSAALASSVEGKDVGLESQRENSSEDQLEEGSEAATDTLQQLLDQETEEFDRICAMTFTRIPAPVSSDGELIGLCDTSHEEGGEEQSSASIDTPRSNSGKGQGTSSRHSPHGFSSNETNKRTPTSQILRGEPSRFSVPKLSLSKLEEHRCTEAVIGDDICHSVILSTKPSSPAALACGGAMQFTAENQADASGANGNGKNEDPRWLAVTGEVKRSTPYIVGAALGSSLKTAAAAIKHSVKYLWTTACSMFNVDFEVPVPAIALGAEASSQVNEVQSNTKVPQGAAVGAAAQLVAPPSTARAPVRNMERKNIDQRFYLAGAMLINASLMWAVANKVKPARLIEPLVDVLQRAFFTAIY
jgi:hypothetical protein